MLDSSARNAHSEIVASWVRGRALSRDTGQPVPSYGGYRVEVGLPDHKARYVFAEASDGVRDAARDIGGPHIFLKVCASPDAVAPLLSEGWSITALSMMMATSGLRTSPARLPAEYSLQSDRPPGGCVVKVFTNDGAVAASGRVFVVAGTAVFDLGLGRAVMGELGVQATRAGAIRGALVASTDGQTLYGALGWRPYSPYTTAVRP